MLVLHKSAFLLCDENRRQSPKGDGFVSVLVVSVHGHLVLLFLSLLESQFITAEGCDERILHSYGC